MSGRAPTKSTTGHSKNNKNPSKAGLPTTAQSNKSSTGSKSNTPGSHQKVVSQLSFCIDIIDNILNCGGDQPTTTLTSTNSKTATIIPQSPSS